MVTGAAMTTHYGLYYPFIHFKDEGWLKMCALYWDGMKRIVPTGTALRDSDDVKRLRDAEFVQDELPGPFVRQLADPFRKLLDVYGEAIRGAYGIHLRETWPDASYTLFHAPPNADPKLAYVFEQKMDPQLVNDLFRVGLIASRADDPRWIGMHPRLANLYMMALAEAMAPRVGARPVTDEIYDHVAISGFTMERLATALLQASALSVPERTEQEIETAMATLAFRFVVPTDPAAIPAEKLIKFRKQYAEERGLFQTEVNRLVAQLQYLTKVDQAAEVSRQLQAEFDKTLKPRLDRLRRQLNENSIDVVEGVINARTEVPALVGAGISAVGLSLAEPVSILGGIALSLFSILRKRRQADEATLKPSAEAYLYLARRDLEPKRVIEEVGATRSFFLPMLA
jgi:hypothetical protein